MATVLAHNSSLELWAHMASSPHAPFRYNQRAKYSADDDGRGAEYWLQRSRFLSEPLHVAVKTPETRRRGRQCASHVVRHLGNQGTIWGIAASLSTVSPAVCLAQHAKTLPLPRLTELACALSGNYCFAAKPTGSVTSAIPLTSLHDMRVFLRAHQDMGGAPKALQAAKFAIDRLGSPYETILYLLLCLPRKHGGYGLPKPEANSLITPSPKQRGLVAQESYYPDLLWPERRLVVEYDSHEYHCSPEQAAKDARRRNDLEALGYHVIVVNKPIIKSPSLFDQMAHGARRHLGIRARKESEHCIERRKALRHLLLSKEDAEVSWR